MPRIRNILKLEPNKITTQSFIEKKIYFLSYTKPHRYIFRIIMADKKSDDYIIVEKPSDIKPDIMPFGLNNTGAICYFNSLIQALLSCKSIYKTIGDITIDSDLNKSITGRTFVQTIRTASTGSQNEQATSSSQLLAALISDLNERIGKQILGKCKNQHLKVWFGFWI